MSAEAEAQATGQYLDKMAAEMRAEAPPVTLAEVAAGLDVLRAQVAALCSAVSRLKVCTCK